MSDHCIVCPMSENYPKVGVYIHHYDEEDLERVLSKCKKVGVRKQSDDPEYCMAWLCHYIIKVFGEEEEGDRLGVGLTVVTGGEPGLLLLDDNFVVHKWGI